MRLSSKRGVLLIIASVVMSVAAVLTTVYLSTLVSEKKNVEDSRSLLQARTLAESGANQAMVELRKRLIVDMPLNFVNKRQYDFFVPTYSSDTTAALNFIRDFAYASGQPQFTVSGGTATLTITPESLNSAVDGNFASTTITISAPSVPTTDSVAETMTGHYSFTIESTGTVTRTSPAISKKVILSGISFDVLISRTNFAKFALFTVNHTAPSGTTVWFTENTNFSGPVHTNDRFSFANNPSGTFSALITQHQNNARFYNNGNSKLADSDRYPVGCTGGGCRDLPQFDAGFSRGQDIINLESSFTQTELENYATGGTSFGIGVHVPNDGTNLTGGIYIKGNQGQDSDNASITMQVNGDGDPVYTIVQSGTTTTVTVNTAANTTRVVSGASDNTYTGYPDGSEHEGILIYSNDNINSLSGTVANTASGKTSHVTVSSERDIVITGNILYHDYTPEDPGTSTKELSAVGFNNMMGIMSWGGNVRIGTAAPDDVVIHGVVLARNGVFTVDNYNSGSSRGTATLLGGMITQFYGAFGTFGGWGGDTGYGRNYVYDARVLSGMAPPYFPLLQDFGPNVLPTDILLQKPTWREKDI